MYMLVRDSTPWLNHSHFTYVYLEVSEYVHDKTKIIWIVKWQGVSQNYKVLVFNSIDKIAN